jgi:hypothetical protein
MANVEGITVSQRASLKVSVSSMVVLGKTFLGERSRLPKTKERLLAEIEASLPQISIDRFSSQYEAIAERFCDFLPRTYASIVTFSLLTGKRYEDLSREGLEASRLFWQVGHKQDDIIDDPLKQTDDRESILQDIFSGEGIGHRKTLALLYRRIESSPQLATEDKHYLRVMVKSWFNFIGNQERELSNTPREQQDFQFCREYREKQNMMAGRVICALLNWSDCRTEKGQEVELILPRFSYMSQIIDDIGDLPEDLAANRPSFAVGALNTNRDEGLAIEAAIADKGIKKFSYDELKQLAPQSTQLLDDLFRDYRRSAFELGGAKTDMILAIAQAAYFKYSRLRNIIYKINPAWATF